MVTRTWLACCDLACRHLNLVGVAFEMGSSWTVTFIGSGCGLPLESVNSTSTREVRLTVADIRPGPLT